MAPPDEAHRVPPIPSQISSNAQQNSIPSSQSNTDASSDPWHHFKFSRGYCFEEVREIFDGLELRKQLCLLSFAIFPKGVIIEKRILVYWWLGERLIEPSDSNTTADELADEILDEFLNKNLIEPAKQGSNSAPNSFKIHSLVRSAVIYLAQEKGYFCFDSLGNPTFELSSHGKACLVDLDEVNSFENGSRERLLEPLEKIQTIFNINMETYPDVELEQLFGAKTVDKLPKMNDLKVLFLGRWKCSRENDVEVKSHESLGKIVRRMKNLRLLSFQGTFRIQALPKSVCKLTNLKVLDLRACHNLEEIPEKIGLLKELTHLDMSECYLLDQMPKTVSWLTNLQVLKGFVISDAKNGKSCTIKDLAGLAQLRRLSINSSRKNFPTKEELSHLKKLALLKKLKVTWGGGKEDSSQAAQGLGNRNRRALLRSLALAPSFKGSLNSVTGTELQDSPVPFPEGLEKLTLQCYCETTPPHWLTPQSFPGLKKLSIEGGGLRTLSIEGDDLPKHVKPKWKRVEVLRLKFVEKLDLRWLDLLQLFPKMLFFEKVKCPSVTLCPCDESGIWKAPKDQTLLQKP